MDFMDIQAVESKLSDVTVTPIPRSQVQNFYNYQQQREQREQKPQIQISAIHHAPRDRNSQTSGYQQKREYHYRERDLHYRAVSSNVSSSCSNSHNNNNDYHHLYHRDNQIHHRNHHQQPQHHHQQHQQKQQKQFSPLPVGSTPRRDPGIPTHTRQRTEFSADVPEPGTRSLLLKQQQKQFSPLPVGSTSRRDSGIPTHTRQRTEFSADVPDPGTRSLLLQQQQKQFHHHSPSSPSVSVTTSAPASASLTSTLRQLREHFRNNILMEQIDQRNLSSGGCSNNTISITASAPVSPSPSQLHFKPTAPKTPSPVMNSNQIITTHTSANITTPMTSTAHIPLNISNSQGLSKYAQLSAVIEEMGRYIRPTYAGSRGSTDRLKRGIVNARMLVRECLMEAERSARQ